MCSKDIYSKHHGMSFQEKQHKQSQCLDGSQSLSTFQLINS